MITSQYARQNYDPQWTQVEFSKGGARDALGIETLSESILADLLPGVNNQTRRARYYSFWAWVLRDFINDSEAIHTQDGFYQWLRRRESTLILAYLAHGCSGGIAGTDQAKEVWLEGRPETFPLTWKSLISVDGGAYELYYRGALQEMNIVFDPDDGKHDALTKSTGLNLANAYAQAVSSTKYVREFLDATRLNIQEVEDYAKKGCLCRLVDHDIERRALIEAFFRFDTPDVYAVKRLASLCFFLDVIAQSSGENLNRREFRAVIYFWSFGDRHEYLPEGNLIEPALRWRVFQLRQYFVFSIEAFWGLFLQRIQAEVLTAPEYIAWLLGEFKLEEFSRKFDFDLPTYDPRELPLRVLMDEISRKLPSRGLERGHIARSTILNEHDLTNSIPRREPRLGEESSIVGNVLLTLALIYLRCQPWRQLSGWRYVSDDYARGRAPVEAFVRHLETAMNEGWSLARWMGWFHHHYLWLQHRRVTLEKLVARRQETAKFELVDGFPTEGTGQQVLPSFLGTGTDRPKMNAPRFPSALNIMEDLKLIKSIDNSGYQLTPEGNDLLRRFRDYVVPEWLETTDEEASDDAEA